MLDVRFGSVVRAQGLGYHVFAVLCGGGEEKEGGVAS